MVISVLDLHHLLLRLSPHLPDELVGETRGWLAAGRTADVTEALLYAVLSAGVAITPAEAALINAPISGSEAPPVPYAVAPVAPQTLAEHGDRVPRCLDLTLPHDPWFSPDDIDRAATSAAASNPMGQALWRCWRYPDDGDARRVYLLQAAEGAPVALVADVQEALITAGEELPLVEGFGDASRLHDYQRVALTYSALLWAAAEPVPIRLCGARVRSSIPDRLAVLSHLDAGTPLLAGGGPGKDEIDRSRGWVVPAGFRTDGRWIWSEADTYHLREHGISPDPELVNAIRASGYTPGAVDEVGLHRALARLYA